MSQQVIAGQHTSGTIWLNRLVGRIYTFAIAATAALTLTVSEYLDSFRATRVVVILTALLLLHLVWHSRFIWRREFTLYACFIGYMSIALLWTRDLELAMNTLVPAVNFILVMILFASLIRFHNVPAVLLGTLCGFGMGAALYTLTQGFPFHYPENFSYNGIAGMYLFGLFATLMYSCFRRSHFVLLAIAGVIFLHIVATTSIKTNLGIVLGLVVSMIMYFAHFGRLIRRRVFVLLLLVSGLTVAVASNDMLVDRMTGGVQRVLVGIKVLQTRDDVAGYSAFEQRDYWKQVGLDGWKINPVFGYGTEAFRDEFGITSHSTPIDLLYNYGLIGFALFYSVFASMLWRLIKIFGRHLTSQRSLILAGIICYIFISLSGTMHYNIFLAAFIGISLALLAEHESNAHGAGRR